MKAGKNNRHEIFVREIRERLDEAILEERKIENNIKVEGSGGDSNSSISLQKELEKKFEELFGPIDD